MQKRSFRAIYVLKNDHFTKTGSGQTQGKESTHKTDAFLQDWSKVGNSIDDPKVRKRPLTFFSVFSSKGLSRACLGRSASLYHTYGK
jgi:hypothetical protein